MLRRPQLLEQLAAARAKPRKEKKTSSRFLTTPPNGRLRIDHDKIVGCIYRNGYTIAEMERIARLPKGSLTEMLRRKTVPIDQLDKLACILERHYTDFEVTA
jgi:hypothetical protein